MPAYLTITVGPSPLDAVPIIASAEDRLVRAALRAIHREAGKIARGEADAPRRRPAHPREVRP